MVSDVLIVALATASAGLAVGAGDPLPSRPIASDSARLLATVRASVRRSVPRLRGFVQGAEAAQARDRAVLDALSTICETLRSGGSLDLGLAAAGRDVAEPVGSAFLRMRERLTLGRSFHEALAAWEREVGGDEALLLGSALRMHHRSGGSLTTVLESLAVSIRDRLDVAAEVRSLTAQARLSAWVVGSLPVGFLAFLALVSGPDFLRVFATSLGAALLIVGSGLQVAAAVWIRRILGVDR